MATYAERLGDLIRIFHPADLSIFSIGALHDIYERITRNTINNFNPKPDCLKFEITLFMTQLKYKARCIEELHSTKNTTADDLTIFQHLPKELIVKIIKKTKKLPQVSKELSRYRIRSVITKPRMKKRLAEYIRRPVWFFLNQYIYNNRQETLHPFYIAVHLLHTKYRHLPRLGDFIKTPDYKNPYILFGQNPVTKVFVPRHIQQGSVSLSNQGLNERSKNLSNTILTEFKDPVMFLWKSITTSLPLTTIFINIQRSDDLYRKIMKYVDEKHHCFNRCCNVARLMINKNGIFYYPHSKPSSVLLNWNGVMFN